MMGNNHALSALPVGLAVAPLIGLDDLGEAAPFAVLTAGYALVPDLDSPKSSASSLLSGFTETLSHTVRYASGAVYEHTKGSRDENWNGKHRHLTHTLLFALVLGGISGVLCAISAWAILPIFLFGLLLAADRLGDWVGWIGLATGLALVPQILLAPDHVGWQVGIAVALGCITHDLGDALTLGGCPLIALLWPWEIHGETWYEIRLLGPFSFRTDGPVEHRIVNPLLIGLTVMAVAQYVSPQVDWLFSLVS